MAREYIDYGKNGQYGLHSQQNVNVLKNDRNRLNVFPEPCDTHI